MRTLGEINRGGLTCDVQLDRCGNWNGHVVICCLAREDGVEILPGDLGDDELVGHFVAGLGEEGVIRQVVIPPPAHPGTGPPAQHLHQVSDQMFREQLKMDDDMYLFG